VHIQYSTKQPNINNSTETEESQHNTTQQNLSDFGVLENFWHCLFSRL